MKWRAEWWYWTALVIIAAVGVTLYVRNYRECRDAGFSRVYCATH